MAFADSQIGYATVTLTATYTDSLIGFATVTLNAPVPKLRVAKVLAQGTATNPKLRISKVTASGAVPLSIPAISDQSSEAYGATTVAVSGSYPPNTAFTWRQISGPPVAFADNGTFIAFTTPTSMTGAVVVFGVTAVLGSQSSAEVTATVNVLPHLYWSAGSSGWVALARQAAA